MDTKKTILIVEDDIFAQRIYQKKFETAGFDTRLAQDGSKVVDILRNNDIDLVILDLIMPVKDGFKVLKDIRANPEWEKLPIIVVSNLGQEEDISKAEAFGITDYLLKAHTSIDKVIQKVQFLLSS